MYQLQLVSNSMVTREHDQSRYRNTSPHIRIIIMILIRLIETDISPPFSISLIRNFAMLFSSCDTSRDVCFNSMCNTNSLYNYIVIMFCNCVIMHYR